MRIEETQIGTNYEVVVLLATLNNKIVNKISVNFKFFNNKRNIFEEEENTKKKTS